MDTPHSTTSRHAVRPGVMSTAEIKFRIEAMFSECSGRIPNEPGIITSA